MDTDGDGDGCEILLNDMGSSVGVNFSNEPRMENDQPVCEEIHRDIISYVEGQETPFANKGHYLSPIKTILIVQIVVSSNHISVVSFVEPPKVGMVFKKWEDVESYYKEYAQQQGFGVTRVQGVFSKGSGRERIALTWRCECWGKPNMKAEREAKRRAKAMDVSGSGGVADGIVCEDELNRMKRTSKKCECTAKVYAGRNRDGDWVLRQVELEHANHKISPSKAKLVKEYRIKHFTSRIRKKLLNFFDEGIPVSQIHGCIATEFNGHENMPLTVKDLQHEVYKARRLKMVGGNCVVMMSYFQQMQAENQHFYHAQRLDDQGRLSDVLWVDARSGAAYDEFGDVVC